MTDNGIVKALECCNGYSCCEECPFCNKIGVCGVNLYELALDLINRQKAKIEKLEKENIVLRDVINARDTKIEILKEENEKLQGDLIEERTRRENAVNAYHELAAENKKLEAEIVMIQKESELLKSRNTIMDRAIAKARAEAIKEYLEKLKESVIEVDVSDGYGRQVWVDAVTLIEIKRIGEEMTEG